MVAKVLAILVTAFVVVRLFHLGWRLIHGLIAGRGPRPPTRAADPLDTPFLVAADGEELLDDRRLCQGGVLVTGTSGAGKSSGVIATLLRVAMARGFGMLLVAPKPGDAAAYMRIAADEGRTADVLVLDATATHRVSFFDTLLKSPGDPASQAQQAAAGFDQFLQVAGRNQQQGGGDDGKFWQESYTRLVRCSIHLLILAGQPVTPTALLRLIHDVPRSGKELRDPRWRQGHLCGLLAAAHATAGANGWTADFHALSDYFLVELVKLSPRTRSVVTAMVTGASDSLVRGIGAAVFGTHSTFDLGEAVAANRIVIVDFPLAAWGELGRMVGTGMKYLVQREALKRPVAADTMPFLVVIDECQMYTTDFDWEFVSIARSFRCPMVLATQGIESLRSLFAGDQGINKVNALVGNLGTHFACLPTWETAKWVTEQLGKRKEMFAGGSVSLAGDWPGGETDAPPRQATGSYSQQYAEELRPEHLMDFRTGGGADGMVDALIVQSGRRFGNGKRYRPVTFQQRR